MVSSRLTYALLASLVFFAPCRALDIANPSAAVESNTGSGLAAMGPAPSENRYDILSKMIRPMAGVLLGGDQTDNRALTLRASVGQVAGRLPASIKGASFSAKIQFPAQVRLEAPVMGETLTVCRNGNKVWAMPGTKIQFLLDQFQRKPQPHQPTGMPLQLPFTAQQAVLLPALFQLEKDDGVAEIGGASCRIISGGLMPEIAKAANAEDFSAKLWICADYTPKRIDIRRNDFAMSFLIQELSYQEGFPASTWQPPAGATDVYKCDAGRIEELLYVVMNSLQMSATDKPWLSETRASGSTQVIPQQQPIQQIGPIR